jgi:hypothetical protein
MREDDRIDISWGNMNRKAYFMIDEDTIVK